MTADRRTWNQPLDRHREWAVSVPDYALAALLAALPARRLGATERARPRSRPGLCRRCGYDLRATPGRCPECGTMPPAPPGS